MESSSKSKDATRNSSCSDRRWVSVTQDSMFPPYRPSVRWETQRKVSSKSDLFSSICLLSNWCAVRIFLSHRSLKFLWIHPNSRLKNRSLTFQKWATKSCWRASLPTTRCQEIFQRGRWTVSTCPSRLSNKNARLIWSFWMNSRNKWLGWRVVSTRGGAPTRSWTHSSLITRTTSWATTYSRSTTELLTTSLRSRHSVTLTSSSFSRTKRSQIWRKKWWTCPSKWRTLTKSSSAL